jgi:uncharacterized protein (DUF2252 family)
MASSAFAFFRGAALPMASDLARTPRSGLTVQACGDAHLANFGAFASPERNLVFDINDFDETLPGPWEWDVERLCASLAILSREQGAGHEERRRLVISAAQAYRTAMREFAEMGTLDVWYARLTAADIIDRWGAQVGAKTQQAFQRRLQKAMSKDSIRAASKLTRVVDGHQRLINEPPLLQSIVDMLRGEERAAFEASTSGALRAYGRTLVGGRRELLEQYTYVDMGRKVVGVGSVGTRCWVALLRGVDESDVLMLQLKEAGESVLAPFAGRTRYPHQGRRVVEGQRLMQASSDIFLGWIRGPVVDGTSRDFYVRQMWDWKVSPDFERATAASLAVMGEACGWTLARAHARSGDRVAIAAYLGGGDTFDRAMADFAETYADQNQSDYDLVSDAARTGRIDAASVV